MNQGKIWCVVNPTVGLPLFLGSVAVTSLIVHYAILSHTPWFSTYWTGGHGKVASADGIGAVASVQAQPGFTVSVAPVSGTGTQTSFLVTVAPSAAKNAEVASAADVTTRTPEMAPTSTQ